LLGLGAQVMDVIDFKNSEPRASVDPMR